MNEFLPEEDLLRYLDGEMDAQEKQEFERLLKEKPLLAEQLLNLRIAIEAVKQAGTVKQVERIHQEMMHELPPVSFVSGRRKLIRLSLSVAASLFLLLVLAGGWWFYQLSGQKVYNQYFIPYTVTPERGSDTAASIQKLYAAEAFLKIDSAVKTDSVYSPEDSLLVALSFLKIEKLAGAIQWLKALEHSPTSFRQDAAYYLGMAYLRAKRYKEALSQFEKIHRAPRHLYYDQVTAAFLRKLKFLTWK